MPSVIMLNSVMLSVLIVRCYTKCHYAECCLVKYCYGERSYSKCYYAVFCLLKCCYAVILQ
jgi:hypothetical protein